MLRGLLVRWVVLALAFAVTAWLINGMTVNGGALDYLWLALLFGVINAVLGTLVRIFTLPLTIVTLGLFSIVVNALMLLVTDALSTSLSIDGFGTAILAAITLSIVSVIMDLLTRGLRG
ncbi:MAG TPA: phage holin family protein [Gaiellales bacterium]|nr:phage holin family protein [Gaiellales bacterium]